LSFLPLLSCNGCGIFVAILFALFADVRFMVEIILAAGIIMLLLLCAPGWFFDVVVVGR
jgi:hypothetical protein